MWKDAIGGGEFDGRSPVAVEHRGCPSTADWEQWPGGGETRRQRAGDAIQMARIAFVTSVGMCGSAASLSSASACGLARRGRWEACERRSWKAGRVRERAVGGGGGRSRFCSDGRRRGQLQGLRGLPVASAKVGDGAPDQRPVRREVAGRVLPDGGGGAEPGDYGGWVGVRGA